MEGLQPPETGKSVILISIKDGKSSICNARVVFSRGKGIILETAEEHDFTGANVSLFYVGGDNVIVLKGAVKEKIAKTRYYFLPSEEAKEMDKREFIRTNIAIDLAVSRKEPAPGRVDLRRTEAELSGSGIRLVLDDHYRENEKLFFVLKTPSGETLNLSGVVVRSVKRADGKSDTAAHFSEMSNREQELLIDLVFKKRFEEIGIV